MWGTIGISATPNAGRGEWFRQAKYGMFIHWGLYSQMGGCWKGRPYFGNGEWIQHRAAIPAVEYAKLAEQFDPVGFDARQWARLAKDAGMRYIVITSKHHDGFAMFRSAVSDFNIVTGTPFGRDPLAELAQGCRQEGLRLGFYYSQTQDWHETDAEGNTWEPLQAGHDFQRYMRTKARPQIRELLTQYGPVAMIWFDTPGPITADESRELRDEVRRCQPDCLINSRIGNDLGDYESLGDNEVPAGPRGGLWETIETHNDTWGFVAHDLNFKSPREIAQRLVRVVSRGGNYMLNIGPDGRGRVPDLSANILRQAGQWVRAHGEAIYGAQPSPIGSPSWGECTAQDGKLYLHLFQWPRDGRLIVPGHFGAVRSAAFVSGQAAGLTADVLPDHVAVRMPPLPPDVLIPVVILELDTQPHKLEERMVLVGMDNRLEAIEATAAGCQLKNRFWMEKFGEWVNSECLTGWVGPDSQVNWTFRTVKGGDFYVQVRYSSPITEETPLWRLVLGQTEVTFPLYPSGEHPAQDGPIKHKRMRLRTYRVGLFALPTAGQHTLTLAPVEGPANQVSVESVILSPAQ